ncbi:MAG: serine dehydratase beta chain, partial [Devosia sp.]
MFLSVFDVFKIGIGSSSSHTMGPMTAAVRFLYLLQQADAGQRAARIRVSLHGSLAFTGKGHATDRAVTLGLLGWLPAELHMETAERQLSELRSTCMLQPRGLPSLVFDPASDIVFDYGPPLPGHANGIVFSALDADGAIVLSETYYSIGGGFVVTAAERAQPSGPATANATSWPYPFQNAAGMLQMARSSGLSIAAMKRENEAQLHPHEEVEARVTRIWAVMNNCIERGLALDGELPGGLRVRRRARNIHQQLLAERQTNSAQPHAGSDWLSVYAMAVNEENAAGGRVVTSPTNGAAGVVPAVLRYYLDHC